MMRRQSFFCKQGNISKINDAGFSLVELIVVVAIMAALVAVISPMYMNTARQRQETACRTNRESIAGIFERRVYDDQKKMEQGDLDVVMGGTDPLTANEIKQYMKCPLKGNFTGTIDGNAIIIKCSHTDHADVRVEVTGWKDSADYINEGVDKPITPP